MTEFINQSHAIAKCLESGIILRTMIYTVITDFF